uniref:Uncharacterized protein n=1 Tax=Anguilla anguilla TaxID=7936 RepID=A0A0E9XJ16_ANGAN
MLYFLKLLFFFYILSKERTLFAHYYYSKLTEFTGRLPYVVFLDVLSNTMRNSILYNGPEADI